jgi:hypothetical protein
MEVEMRRTTALLAIAPLLLSACGGDDEGGGQQAELAEMLIAETPVGADEACLRDKTGELSDDDAQFLIDNFDATDTGGFDAELVEWIDSLIECFDLDATGG